MQCLRLKRPVGLGTTRPLQQCQVHLPKQCGRRRHLQVLAGLGHGYTLRYKQHEQPQQRGDRQTRAGAVGDYPSYNPQPAADYAYNPQPYNPQSLGATDSSASLGEAARQSLAKATQAMSRYGWIGFWVQLTLSVVSAVILLFSVAFTSQSGPKASLYLTLVGILAGFLSTFWNFGYQRTANRMQEYLDGANVARIKKQQVTDLITRGVLINLVGLGSTLIGISTLVGLLVAKTLGNASINPFIAGTATGYNPVLALDVFLVQAATNTLLGHFLSLLCSLWLLSVVGEGRGLRFQRKQHMQRIKYSDDTNGNLISGTVKGFAGVYDIPKALGGRGGTSGPGRSGDGGSGTRGGRSLWRVRPVAATAAAAGVSGGVTSVGVATGLSVGSGGGSMVKRTLAGGAAAAAAAAAAAERSNGRVSPGVPVVAAAAVAEQPAAAYADPVAAGADVLAAAAAQPRTNSTATAAGPAPAAAAAAAAAAAEEQWSRSSARKFTGGSSPSSSSSSSSGSTAGLAGLPASFARWQAAARPAAAASAATAAALEAAGLPAPPIRIRKTPEQRLDHDSLIFPTRESLTYLTGELPGDQGFDPLGLFSPENPEGRPAGFLLQTRRFLVTSEVMHGRWAMLGVLGCLLPEILGGKAWFQTGWLPPAGTGNYWADVNTLFVLQMTLMGVAEGCRLRDFRNPGSMAEPLQVLLPQGSSFVGGFAGSGSPPYPGGPVFNFLSYVRDLGPAVGKFKEAEIRHGRLAMLAMLGFAAQAVVTREGPWANLLKHLESPGGFNVLTSLGGLGGSFGWIFGGEEGSEWGLHITEALAAVAAGAALLGVSLLAA